MFKKLEISISLIGIITILILHSCVSDDSSFATNTIDGVEIDTTGMAVLSVSQFDTLHVQPHLEFEGSEDSFSYKWKINRAVNDTVYTVLSRERNLNEPIILKPTTAGRQHQLVYTVTDEITGLEYIMVWPLRILNNIGEGIVVVETDGNGNSDLSHIMSREVTPEYTSKDADIKHNVFSQINQTEIPGITKQIKYYQFSGKDYLLGITDDLIYRIDQEDYSIDATNSDLFFTPRSSYSIDLLDQVYQGSLVIQDGKLTSTYLGAAAKFGIPFPSDYTIPDVIATNPIANQPVTITFLDEEKGMFVYQPSITAFGDSNMYEIPKNDGDVFDPTVMKGSKSIAAGVGANGDFRHLIKNATGEVELYIFNGGESIYPDIIPPKPIRYYNLSEAPGIEQAEFFAFIDDQRILYYATKNKIYAVLYSSSKPIFEERYSLLDSQEITTFQIYQQADYPQRASGDYNNLNNRALLVSSYDGQEGKVYLLPFIHSGLGDIDEANITVFSGFDRITALSTQL